MQKVLLTGSQDSAAVQAPEVIIAPISLDCAWENRQLSMERAESSIRAVADRGASLVLLPEMFSTGFSMKASVVYEDPEDSPSLAFMREMSRKYNLAIIGGFSTGPKERSEARNSDPRGHNSCAAIDPKGEIVGLYEKNHLFPVAGEPEFFLPGTGRSVVSLLGMRIALYICYDLRFPETFMFDEDCLSMENEAFMGIPRQGAMPSYDAIAIVASWPGSRDRHWRTLLQARAIENQAWVFACNRRGEGGGLLYGGSSMVIDPLGNIVAEDERYRPWFTCAIDPGYPARARELFRIQGR